MVKSGTKLGLFDLSSDVLPVEYLVAKSGTKSGLVDLNSNVPPPLVEASSSQDWY